MESTAAMPTPEQSQQRIADCEIELRSLWRLLRIAQSMRDAEQARARRGTPGQRRSRS
jgi:hypothetical protein